MADILHELENNEAVLLMYLADELAPRDKAEVEQMLDTDRSLNELFLELRLAHAAAMEGLRLVDAREPLPVPPQVVARRAKASIRRWTDDRFAPVVSESAESVKRKPAWRRNLAIAASLMMVLGGIWLIRMRHDDAHPQVASGYDSQPGERPSGPAVPDPDVDPALRDALDHSKLTSAQETALLEGSLPPAATTAPSDEDASAAITNRTDEPVIGLERPQWEQGRDVLSDLFDGIR